MAGIGLGHHPLSSFLLKVTNRCNFDCARCYFRHHADQAYRKRPVDMSIETLVVLAGRLGEYARVHTLESVDILFHGGEPLIRGVSFFDQAVQILRDCLPVTCDPHFSLQTNASLITNEWVDCFHRNQLSVSVSLDGPRRAQDRHRRLVNGQSSFDLVMDRVRLLQEHRWGATVMSGALAVVDLRDDPDEVFAFHRSVGLPFVDYLWPDGTHDSPPPFLDDFRADTQYARWSSSVFDTWFQDGSGEPGIRFFENALALLFGGQSNTEGLGSGELSLVTIQTDGEIQDSDILAVAFENAGRFEPGFFVGRHCFDDVTSSVSYARRAQLYKADGLCLECRGCTWRDVCSGGMLPHRYGSRHGFDAPSVYCGNIKYLLRHIQDAAAIELARADSSPLGVVLSSDSPNAEPRGINEMENVSDFLACWDRPRDESFTHLPPVVGLRSHVNVDGDIDNPTAEIACKTARDFLSHLEIGVAEACDLLIHRLGLVTYSSCQGHELPDGRLRERDVGVLPRSEDELRWTRCVLTRMASAAHLMAPQGVTLLVEENALRDTSQGVLYRTLDLRFSSCGVIPPTEYFKATEATYDALVCVLRYWTRALPPHALAPDPPMPAEDAYSGVGTRRPAELGASAQLRFRSSATSSPEQREESERIRRSLCSREIERVDFSSGYCNVHLGASIYPDESEVVLRQATRSKVVVVHNHAWALLAWSHAIDRPELHDPSRSVWITRFDAHTDMMAPSLGVSSDGRSLTNLLTHDVFTGHSCATDIMSGAIAPGSFTLPFCYGRASVTLDYAAPDRVACESAEAYLPSGSYSLCGVRGACVFAPDSKALAILPKESGPLRWSVGLCGDKLPPRTHTFWILDVDCDYFNNSNDGSDFVPDGGSEADEIATRRLRELRDWLEALPRLPDLVTVSLSPDFCPAQYGLPAADALVRLLRSRLDSRGKPPQA